MTDLHYFRPDWIIPSDQALWADLCVYGATSAGVTAAIEAVRRGKTAVILHPGKFIGGLTSGGLGWTDHGRKHVIGGLAREFYRQVGRHYNKDEEFQFEPHVASAVYDAWLRMHNVPVRLGQYLDGVETQAGRIISITMLGGLRIQARMFIDATYEGDLMAKAGVSFTVGREGNEVYGETINGIQVMGEHQFSYPVDPYVRAGEAASGLLPGIEAEDLSLRQGHGDHRVQAYNFRVCMTDDPALKIDWQKPDGFNPLHYVLAQRWLAGEKNKGNEPLFSKGDEIDLLRLFSRFPNKTAAGHFKTDTNNFGPVSSDFIGGNYAWPQASYADRETIFQNHVTYQQGYYWFVANSPDVPDRYGAAYCRWGLAKDEFTTTANWPPQLYVREARRMIGAHVITEHDCRGQRRAADPVGMGSYGMDSHNCTRFVKIEDGKARVLNEGNVEVPAQPYGIPYRSIVPRKSECANLLVPVCLSSSHSAYGSARMEPVFMVLGQSAATAACLAIDGNVAVQDVSYEKLRGELLAGGQVLAEPKA